MAIADKKNFGIEIEGIDDVIDEIDAYINTIDNINSLFDEIALSLKDVANNAVATQKSATTSQALKALTPTTQKMQKKPPRPSLYNRSFGGAIDIKVASLTNKSAAIYSTLPYSGIHQFGNPTNKLFGHSAPIPARPFLPIKKDGTFTEKYSEELDDIINEWIDAKLEENRK